jgi:hypothetical protein
MSTSFVPRAVAFAAVTLVLIVVGCVGPLSPHGRPIFEQKGQVAVDSGAEKVVKFPTAFTATPVVDVKDDWTNNLKVTECKPDHFRVRNDSYQTVQVSWTAQGESPAPPTPPK